MNLTEENNLLKRSNKIYFIGVGGIGISAIARMMLLQDKKVSGSDRELSFVTKELQKLGAKVYRGHRASNLKDADLVVYTTAISENNPELKKAKKVGIPTLSYPEVLGLISKDKYTIAVSGAHGKTTSTAMIGKILKDAKLDPTVIVGSLSRDVKSNFVAGKSRYFICEACEYKKAFLNLHPKIIVITNIDDDHLDYYKNLRNIQRAFSEFVSKLGKKDYLVYNGQDENSRIVFEKVRCKKIDFSKKKEGFKLKIPGEHNVQNAKAALAVAEILNIDFKRALKSLVGYSGVWRRFEHKGKTKNSVLVYDDYAHHPTEIRATLKAAREFFGKKRIFCVFQPHLFSRTKFLFKDFTKSFKDADVAIITDIYAAREKNDERIHAKNLTQEIPGALYIESFQEIEKFLRKNTRKNDVIVTLGAGDVFKISENLVK